MACDRTKRRRQRQAPRWPLTREEKASSGLRRTMRLRTITHESSNTMSFRAVRQSKVCSAAAVSVAPHLHVARTDVPPLPPGAVWHGSPAACHRSTVLRPATFQLDCQPNTLQPRPAQPGSTIGLAAHPANDTPHTPSPPSCSLAVPPCLWQGREEGQRE